MKRTLEIFLVVLVMLSLLGCVSEPAPSNSDTTPSVSQNNASTDKIEGQTPLEKLEETIY